MLYEPTSTVRCLWRWDFGLGEAERRDRAAREREREKKQASLALGPPKRFDHMPLHSPVSGEASRRAAARIPHRSLWGVGCGVWGVGCGVQGVGCIVQGVGCRVWDVRCSVQCAGCGVYRSLPPSSPGMCMIEERCSSMVGGTCARARGRSMGVPDVIGKEFHFETL